jgi:hypothetical protein
MGMGTSRARTDADRGDRGSWPRARPSLGRRVALVAVAAATVAFGIVGCHGRANTAVTARPPAGPGPGDLALPPGPLGPPVLLSHHVWPTGLQLEGLAVGGLSDLARDDETGDWWAVVDDGRDQPPPRLLRLSWHPPAAPEPLDWLFLRDESGEPLPGADADLEGLALVAGGGFLISSEGRADEGLPPWVARFDASGRLIERLELPGHYLPAEGRGAGRNAGFEALAAAAGGALLAGMEGALLQDEAVAAVPAGGVPQPAAGRLLLWPPGGRGLPREWRYPLDPPHAPAPLTDAFRVAGLVDLAPLPGGGFLTLERSFVAGVGFAVRLYASALAPAAEVTGLEALPHATPAAVKRLVLDLGTLGVPLDNYEGIDWAPAAVAGERVLVIVSDNNFSAAQETHWVALRWPR